jgi:hypothetical protein
MGSIMVSYFTMEFLKFEHKTRIRRFSSCVLYFGTVFLIDLVFFSLIKLLLYNGLDVSMMPNDIIIVISLISKSYLWGIVRIYILIAERNIKYYDETVYPILINLIYIIILILVIFLILKNDILDEWYGISLIIIEILIGPLFHHSMYLKLIKKSMKGDVEYLLKEMNLYDRQYIKDSYLKTDRIARFHHDIKNHLTYIAFSIENKNYNKAKSYILDLIDITDLNAHYVNLTNDSLNFIINYKINQANKKKIKVFVQIEDFKVSNIAEIDLCILLCNILDNAIEAVESQAEKRIYIEIFKYAGYQTYLVKNTIETSVLGVNPSLNTTKSQKEYHGYGLKQISDVIKKYNGYMDIYELEKIFCIKILVPLS